MDNGEWPIHYGYMQFSTEVSTRAQLVTDMKGKSFGVLGYQYSPTTNWATAKPVTAPIADFYNLAVSCADNGNCSYDAFPSDDSKDLKEWAESNYSFFAYYPYTTEDNKNNTGITISKNTDTNTPTLTYTYPWLNGSGKDWFISNYEVTDNKKDVYKYDVVNLATPSAPVYDVMTAEAIDVNGHGSGKVGLDFKHRMFALEVLANNYNENTEGTNDARQFITNLVVVLNGLDHSSMTIPMSMQGDEVQPDDTAPGTRSFLISDKMVTIPAFNEVYEGRGEGIATSISKLGGYNNQGYLMLIPQKTGLSGKLYWNELHSFSGEISNEFTSNIEFKAGRLYQLYINYAGDGITIALIEAGAWDVYDVEHKFE